MNDFSLEGKVAIIIGGSKGFAALAAQFKVQFIVLVYVSACQTFDDYDLLTK